MMTTMMMLMVHMVVHSGLARAVSGSANLFNQASINLTVHLRAVQCDGNEVSLLYCPFQLNNGACGHDQDAGVFCLGERATTTTTTIATTTRVPTSTLPPRICELPLVSQFSLRLNSMCLHAEGPIYAVF